MKRLVFLSLVGILLLTACGRPPTTLKWPVEEFAFTNQEGQPFGLADLEGKVWVADFVFTNCVTVCLPMTTNMLSLQEKARDEGVDITLVSFTVDPDRDSPEVLRAYGESYEVDFNNWHFVTGYTSDEIKQFSEKSFKSLVIQESNSDQVSHGTAFFLVNDEGVIVQRYEGSFDAPIDQMISDAKALIAKGKKK